MGRPTAPVRIDPDLFESAKTIGASERRSAAQQVDYWARLGRAVTMPETAARRRIEQVVAGELPRDEVSAEELRVADASIDLAIVAAAEAVPLGEAANASGVTTVALDEQGRLVEHRPDGSTVVVG